MAGEASACTRGGNFDAKRDSAMTLREEPHFTERQRQVVHLLAHGCSNVEIAARLHISPRTAKAHSDILRVKLGVPRRRQIPAAFRAATGEDPHDLGVLESAEIGHEDAAVT